MAPVPSAILLPLAVIVSDFLGTNLIRRRFFGTGFPASFVSVTLGGAIIAVISASLGTSR